MMSREVVKVAAEAPAETSPGYQLHGDTVDLRSFVRAYDDGETYVEPRHTATFTDTAKSKWGPEDKTRGLRWRLKLFCPGAGAHAANPRHLGVFLEPLLQGVVLPPCWARPLRFRFAAGPAGCPFHDARVIKSCFAEYTFREKGEHASCNDRGFWSTFSVEDLRSIGTAEAAVTMWVEVHEPVPATVEATALAAPLAACNAWRHSLLSGTRRSNGLAGSTGSDGEAGKACVLRLLNAHGPDHAAMLKRRIADFANVPHDKELKALVERLGAISPTKQSKI
jgi:hypothetical protein